MLKDNNYMSWGENTIMYVTAESLNCIHETNIILGINNTSIKKIDEYIK